MSLYPHAPLQVKFDYEAQEPTELSLVVDQVWRARECSCLCRHVALQVISVLEEDDSGWWKGTDPKGTEGWFPSNYIERI